MDTIKFNGLEVPSIIQSLKPVQNQSDWVQIDLPMSNFRESITATAWLHKAGFFCISAVEHASEGEPIDKGAEYHLSFSKRAVQGIFRCDTNEVNQCLRDFAMGGAEEDNHAPYGKVRNFWRPVNENLIGLVCPCKDDEPAIRENKGDYVWRPA